MARLLERLMSGKLEKIQAAMSEDIAKHGVPTDADERTEQIRRILAALGSKNPDDAKIAKAMSVAESLLGFRA